MNPADRFQDDNRKVEPGLPRPRTSNQEIEVPPVTRYVSRGEQHDLSRSELLILREIATFRTIHSEDLAEFHFGRQSAKRQQPLPASVRWLEDQGLIETRTVTHSNKRRVEKVQVLTVTPLAAQVLNRALKNGRRYSHRIKPRELLHDAGIYRMYQIKTQELAANGARSFYPVPDFDLKRKVNSRLAAIRNLKPAERRKQKQLIAADFRLPVIEDKIVLPDLRVEYETPEGETAHVDLELVTPHYRSRHISQKTKARFALYSSGDGKARPYGPEVMKEIFAL